MRRMLTEKDVDKIDSIDPADIETLKATGSPKNASSGYVLTADGKGKATYKYKSDGTLIQWQNWQNFSLRGLTTDEDGNKFFTINANHGNTVVVFGEYLNGSIKADGVSIPLAETTLMPYSTATFKGYRVYFSDTTINKYNLTTETQFTGEIRYSFYYR